MNNREFRQYLADLLERKRKEAEAEAAKIQKKPPTTQKPQTPAIKKKQAR
jgi:hypothetical protein